MLLASKQGNLCYYLKAGDKDGYIIYHQGRLIHLSAG